MIPFFFQSELILQLKKHRVECPVPFDFTAKKQADLQAMIDEWVAVLTYDHVGVCSFVIPADEI